MTKICTRCEEEKEVTLFHTQRRKGKEYPYSSCKDCFNQVQAKDYLKTKGTRYTQKSLRRKVNPEKFYKWNRTFQLKKYGLSIEGYDKLFEKQKGLCAICLKPSNKKLFVDHNHKTGEVRGLLCGPCNQAIGLLYEEVRNLQRAIAYLTKFDAPK